MITHDLSDRWGPTIYALLYYDELRPDCRDIFIFQREASCSIYILFFLLATSSIWLRGRPGWCQRQVRQRDSSNVSRLLWWVHRTWFCIETAIHGTILTEEVLRDIQAAALLSNPAICYLSACGWCRMHDAILWFYGIECFLCSDRLGYGIFCLVNADVIMQCLL